MYVTRGINKGDIFLGGGGRGLCCIYAGDTKRKKKNKNWGRNEN